MSVEYGADQIQILEGLEAVRKRPGMYIGSTSSRGLHHLVYEIVDNAVDEALAGFCDHIEVTINEDNSITVVDNGRGIPVGINHKAGIPAVEVVFTILHAGGKFGGGGYKVSGGLHGVGASVVNALSDWLEVEICQGGKVYKQRYERGHVCYPLKEIGTCDLEKTGTKVTFKPDATIFTETTVYEFDILKTRLREMAFLTKGLKISLTDLRGEEPHTRTFHYEGGIREFVTYLNGSKVPLYDKVMYFEGTKNNVYVEVALQHVGTVALEREDGRIVEHAEQSYNPEHLRREDLAEVAELELFLRVGSLFCDTHLLVECLVHEGEDDEGDETDEEEHGAERYRSYYCAEVVGDDWRDREDSEHADACDSHLKTHSESHLLALEPLRDCLGNGCTCHLAAAAEEHETEASHLCACREVYPPRVEPLGKGGLSEPVGDADELDECADEHHRS